MLTAQRLLWRINRRYATVRQELTVAGAEISFLRVADPDLVLDQVANEEDRLEKVTGERTPEDRLHLPYWAELWDSASAVAQVLPCFGGNGAGTEISVLDLGCGMGLAGTVAARVGMRVLFADLEAAPLLFARLNSFPDAPRVRTRKLDWRTDCLDERFDLILGADILYERKQWDYLEPFWRAHLSPAGAILLGEPGRQTGDLFPDWIRPRGWHVEIQHRKVATRELPIRIFNLRTQ